jgi:HPt (histidine-containing phosphotransfer) domain-containing protein
MTDSQSVDSGETPHFDGAALDRLRRFGGGKLLTEMIGLFLEALPERLEAARAGLVAGEASEVERALHSLKSSSAQLGAIGMQRLCELGEQEARSGMLDGLPAVVQKLEAEAPVVVSWLKRALTSEGS